MRHSCGEEGKGKPISFYYTSGFQIYHMYPGGVLNQRKKILERHKLRMREV